MKLIIVPMWLKLLLDSTNTDYKYLDDENSSGILSKRDVAFYLLAIDKIKGVVNSSLLNGFDIERPAVTRTGFSEEEIQREVASLSNVKYRGSLSPAEYLTLTMPDNATAEIPTDGVVAVGLETLYSGPEGLYVMPVLSTTGDIIVSYENMLASMVKSHGVAQVAKLSLFESYVKYAA